MNIDIKVSGVSELVRRLEALKGLTTSPEVDKALGKGGAKIQAQVKMLTPTGYTGNLKNKIFLLHEKLMEYAIATNVEYAVYVEYGTGRLGDPSVPHTSKDHWTYYDEHLQKFITTHGQKPAHMFTNGFAKAHRTAFETVQKNIKEIIRNAGR